MTHIFPLPEKLSRNGDSIFLRRLFLFFFPTGKAGGQGGNSGGKAWQAAPMLRLFFSTGGLCGGARQKLVNLLLVFYIKTC